MVLAVLGVVIQAGTMNLQTIVVKQNSDAIFGWDGLGYPYILTQFVGFLVFMIAVQAELTQTPFDMPIAESELVSGLHDRVLAASASSSSSSPSSPPPVCSPSSPACCSSAAGACRSAGSAGTPTPTASTTG